MLCWTNSQASREFRTSPASIGRWVAETLEKNPKYNLILEQNADNGKWQIVKNEHNRAELTRLVNEHRKYVISSELKRVKPTSEFYNIFKYEEIIEIINDLSVSKEINHKFTYKNRGAGIWDEYYLKNSFNNNYPTPNRVINLLRENFDYITYSIQTNLINIVDIGQGNSYPVKNFLQKVLDKNAISKYIALDVSKEMNNISEKNIKNWYPKLSFLKFENDVENDRLDKILFSLKKPEISNVLLYLGSMLGQHSNRVDVLNNFRKSMSKDDLLILSNTLDNKPNRGEFSYVKNPQVDKQTTWILDSLGIDVSLGEMVMKYDENKVSRILSLKLDKDYIIEFEVKNQIVEVELHQGDEITVWRHQMTQIPKLLAELDEAGLEACQISCEKDMSHVLVIAKTKRG